MNTVELKSCPFCAADASLEIDADHHGEFFHLGCSTSDCQAQHIFYCEQISQLYPCIEKWNTRGGEKVAYEAVTLQSKENIELQIQVRELQNEINKVIKGFIDKMGIENE